MEKMKNKNFPYWVENIPLVEIECAKFNEKNKNQTTLSNFIKNPSRMIFGNFLILFPAKYFLASEIKSELIKPIERAKLNDKDVFLVPHSVTPQKNLAKHVEFLKTRAQYVINTCDYFFRALNTVTNSLPPLAGICVSPLVLAFSGNPSFCELETSKFGAEVELRQIVQLEKNFENIATFISKVHENGMMLLNISEKNILVNFSVQK